jgi:hypothetical protein
MPVEQRQLLNAVQGSSAVWFENCAMCINTVRGQVVRCTVVEL